MDVEARILWCMEKLQGFERTKLITRPHPAAGTPVKDLGAIATYVASRSNGQVFTAAFSEPKEREALALGEALFFRRSGPMDFACSTCHADSGKRIRLQPLPFFSKPEEARRIVGQWPAYRVSTAHVMTMQHRIYDCLWQMRLPEIELGSDVSVALIGRPLNSPQTLARRRRVATTSALEGKANSDRAERTVPLLTHLGSKSPSHCAARAPRGWPRASSGPSTE
jgi:sulfur-oxidizing protein SoxA